MLASDDRNSEFTGARNPDEVLHVTFHIKTMPNNFLSAKEGRPVFQDEQFVRIMIPGRNDTVVERPVEELDKQRFPRQWAVFMNQQSETDQLVGTPITEWPQVTRSQAEELKGKKFYTVEQIAECSDGQIQALGMNATLLRQKARLFLATAKDTALVQGQVEELARKDAEIAALQANQKALSDQMLQMNAALQALGDKKKERKPMSEEARKAAGERLRLAREAKRAKQETVSG